MCIRPLVTKVLVLVSRPGGSGLGQSEMDKIMTYAEENWRDRRLISNLYLQQEAITRVMGNGYSEPACIGRGLWQGCILSPVLF